jgi:lysine 2,3-aminomutase
MKRHWKYTNIHDKLWRDWHWQLANRLHSGSEITDYFPNIGRKSLADFKAYTARFNLSITPYALSLVRLDRDLNPLPGDPVWRQFRFLSPRHLAGNAGYDGVRTNWELSKEMPTPILHHKYPGRALLRVVNTCHGYCTYCYLTKRTLDSSEKWRFAPSPAVWQKSLRYLRAHPEITDVLISGGDPLLLSNRALEKLLGDIADIPSVRTTRINTRALTFNPFRVDAGLAALLKKFNVTALEIHLGHPNEITADFDSALARLDKSGHRPLILWRSPLIRGVNDSKETLRELFLRLYERRITPYYLFHSAPYTLGRNYYGTSVKHGIRLMKELRREVPGAAFPRYTLFHTTGKQDIPLEPSGTPDFRFCRDTSGKPTIKFRNWRGRKVFYPDR